MQIRTVVAEQGVAGLWRYTSRFPANVLPKSFPFNVVVFHFYRGNLANCIRVVPYSGLQFASYGYFKENVFAVDAKGLKS
jgi:hypothetical protein